MKAFKPMSNNFNTMTIKALPSSKFSSTYKVPDKLILLPTKFKVSNLLLPWIQ